MSEQLDDLQRRILVFLAGREKAAKLPTIADGLGIGQNATLTALYDIRPRLVRHSAYGFVLTARGKELAQSANV